MLKHLATPVRIVGTALVLIAVPCFAQTTKQSNGHATKNSKPSARKPVIADLKPTIDNGQANRAVISAWRVSDWLLFSLKKGSEILYCGQMWILPGTSAGGMLTDARGDRYSYSADGLPTGDHMQLLPGSVAIKNDNAHHRGPGHAARTPCLGGPDADTLIAPPPRNQSDAHLYYCHCIEITQYTPNHKHVHHSLHQQFHNHNDYSTYGRCLKGILLLPLAALGLRDRLARWSGWVFDSPHGHQRSGCSGRVGGAPVRPRVCYTSTLGKRGEQL